MDLTSLLRTEVAAAMAVALAAGLLLLAARPNDRASTRNALFLLGLSAAAAIGAAALRAAGALAVAGIFGDVAAIAVGIALIRLAGILFFRLLLPTVRVQPARIIEDLATAGFILAWGMVWLRLAGVDLGSLVTTSAVITAVVAFSMQETLGNILGGVVLQLDQSIRVGDWVKLDDTNGRVVEIRWRHTAVETRNRETVVIPNGWLMKNRFTVIGSRADPSPLWRRWVYFDVGIDSSPLAVCDVLVACVTDAQIPNVAREPAPSAVLMKIGDGYGHYALRYFLTDPQPDDPTDSLVRAHAIAALTRHGLSLAVPREERILIKDNEAHRGAEHAKEHARRQAALARVDLFSPLSDAERAELAEHLVYAPFLTGDTVTRQGSVAHWLYLVVKGEAEVWIEDRGTRTRVSTITPGGIFGEMGMMTGAPRQATITARSDLECYRLDKTGFEKVLRSRPDIAGEMSRVLAARERELSWRRDSAGTDGKTVPRQDDMLQRIRSFFGLGA
jgi:small-conductance mechanosensitive channel